MERTIWVLAIVTVGLACKERDLTTANGDPASTGDAGPAAAVSPMPAASNVVLPDGWEGEGVLVVREERIPRRAPAWAKTLVEVVRRDDQRFVQATGKAARVKNEALARSTAVNRARAQIARWVRSNRLVGAVPIDEWRDPRTSLTFARVAMPVPDDWIPGRPVHPRDGGTPTAPAP